MKKIIITHLKNGGVTAHLEGYPMPLAHSPNNHHEAMGMLIVPMQEELGITIEHRREEEKKS